MSLTGHAHAGEEITSGTVADARLAGSIARDGEIVPSVLAADGPGSTLDADLLDGLHASALSPTAHTRSGADIASGTVADATCDPIQLAAGAFTTSLSIARDVTLTGAGSASTSIAGWVAVTGATTDAVLNALRIDAASASSTLCNASGLEVRGGAKAGGSDLIVVGRPTPTAGCGFFADGFESGDLALWSARRP